MVTTKRPHTDLSQVSCASLHGVGKRMAERLSKLGITQVQDLLFHLPLRYQDRTRIRPMNSLLPGEHVVVEGTIETISTPIGGRTRLLCLCSDGRGHITLRFFFPTFMQRKILQPGTQLRCFGEVRLGAKGLEMIHPELQITSGEEPLPDAEFLTPIYPTTEGLSQPYFRKLMLQVLTLLESGAVLQDILPQNLLKDFSFPHLKDALLFVHKPPPDAPVQLLEKGKHHAQQRLVFEELLAHRLSLLHLKKLFQSRRAVSLPATNVLLEKFLQTLPFSLTRAQERVRQEINQDLCRAYPMLRLIQGDVGSGKTVVAACAVLQAVENGYQAAVMAPTELLAEQHAQNFRRWFEPLGIKVVYLSGQMKAQPRRDVLAAMTDGSAAVIIGTHALFQKDVEFARLALIVVDEQHRFGVHQRSALRDKGIAQGFFPHQLIMSATPIPRTLAMSVYADLDNSIIDELPPGRTPVTTIALSNARRDEVLQRIREACHQGRQVYWVCTLIEESEVLQCQAAEVTAQQLNVALPELQIGLLHGRMKNTDKEAQMAAFKAGKTQLLVATTVIEVGVDVPNASLMVIENSERLGLAQLHQLRGRIGRGAVKSHCVLMYQLPLSHLAKERLAVMRETNDGFQIAERDLQLRGPGEVLGTRQTGELSLRIADLVRDSDLLAAVQQAANVVVSNHKELIDPLIKRWIGNNEQYGHV